MENTRIKICGLTRRVDVDAVIAQGAWALGFVVWPGSPRAVTLDGLQELIASVPPGIKRVGVTVNPTVDEVRALHDAGMTTVQLHGDEEPEPFLSLGLEVFKAMPLITDADVDRAAGLPGEVTVLVDAHDQVKRGGTGQPADWSRAERLARMRPVILAGGLREENVGAAIERVRPWAIDVSSGLESAPGIKDHAKLERFFATMKTLGTGKQGVQ